jgi:cytochrome P450
MPQPEGSGFWAVVRHADIGQVSKDPQTFCSGRGVMLDNVPDEVSEAANSFLSADAPRHARLRKLVSSAFTPRQVTRIEEQIHQRVRRIVDDLIDTGDCDFVAQVAKPLPMATIFDMVGLDDPRTREQAVGSVDGMTAWSDEDIRAGREPVVLLQQSLMTLVGLGMGLIAERRAAPREDLISNLVAAEVDGERLTDQETCAFFVLLSVAGNDTTRHTTAHAMRALSVHPDQRVLLMDDLEVGLPAAVEEFVRWASPVMTFRRTTTTAVELHGQRLAAGEKVVLFYHSGNRDERAFEEPWRFDVRRDPNHHLGFGGGGPHYCLGASLARTQLRSIFGEILRLIPDIEAGEPELLRSAFIHGVKRMDCSFTPRA